MFVARTGLKTRGGSTTAGAAQSGLTALLGPKRRKEDEVGFYCWVPFMWKPCIAGLLGLTVLLGGTAMSVLGYYAPDLATERVSNGTHAYHVVNDHKRISIGLLTYVGPVVMGFGCFTIVVACVVVCEQRDKEIRVKIEARKRKKLEKKEKKGDFYDAIVERLKKSKVYNARMLKDNDKQKDLDKAKDTQHSEVEKLVQKDKNNERTGLDMAFSCFPAERSRNYLMDKNYEHISSALMSIPMDIFTLHSHEGTTSLLPVRLPPRTDPTLHIQQYKLAEHNGVTALRKCPSASCIPDLAKVTEARLDQVFPDRRLWLKRSHTDLGLQVTGLSRDSESDFAEDGQSEHVSSQQERVSPAVCQEMLLDETSSRTTPSDCKSTCSNAHSENSHYTQCSRTCSKGTSPQQSNHHSNDSLPASDSGHSSARSLSVLPLTVPAERSIQETPTRPHHVILHYASVHSDAHGGNPTPLPHVDTLPGLAMGDEDPEVVALTRSVARSNALQMDTFRKHRACRRALAQSPSPDRQTKQGTSEKRHSIASAHSSESHQDSSIVILDCDDEHGDGAEGRSMADSNV